MEVSLDLDDKITLGAPRRLWTRAQNGWLSFQGYEVPPPGDRVLGITYQELGDTTPSIGIVQNWYEEFREHRARCLTQSGCTASSARSAEGDRGWFIFSAPYSLRQR